MTAMSLLLACVMGCPAPTEAPPPEPVYMRERVWLGVDCSPGAEPFVVALPDDVLIGECETEGAVR